MANYTIARALAKVKILQSDLDDIRNTAAVCVNGFIDGKGSNNDVKEYLKVAQATWDSKIKLLDNINRLKFAIADANVKTKVIFQDKQYSLLEAINLKESLRTQMSILNSMRAELTEKTREYNKKITKQDDDIQRIIEQSFANKNNQPKDAIENITANFKIANRITLESIFTEEDIIARVSACKADIKELDFLLSEANATTTIQVSLDD